MRSAIRAGRHAVDLVERDHGGPTAGQHARRDEAIARAGLVARVEHEQHRVDVGEALVDRALHLLGERVARALEPGQIGQDELGARGVHHPEHAPARRLRLVRDDRHVIAAERVRERGLADVGAPGETHEAAVERRSRRCIDRVRLDLVRQIAHASRADEAASGKSTSRVSTTTSPSYRWITGSAGANSASTCRQPPHGSSVASPS